MFSAISSLLRVSFSPVASRTISIRWYIGILDPDIRLAVDSIRRHPT